MTEYIITQSNASWKYPESLFSQNQKTMPNDAEWVGIGVKRVAEKYWGEAKGYCGIGGLGCGL